MKKVIAIWCVLLATASFAQSLINIDACSGGPAYSGAAVIGQAGDVWNVSGLAGVPDLLDSAGSSTGVSFTTDYNGQYNKTGTNAEAGIKPLVQDYFYGNSLRTLTLSGLTPNTGFTVYIYAGEGGENSRGGEWSIDTDGDGFGNDPKVIISAMYSGNQIPGVASMTTPASYAVLTGTVGSNGSISIKGYPSVAGGWVNLMGLQIQASIDKPKPYSPTPSNGAVNVDPFVVSSVSWEEPFSDGIASVVGYDVYWSVGNPQLPQTPTVTYLTQGTSRVFTPAQAITYDTAYYWRIDAHVLDGLGDPNTVVGTQWSFTTKDALPEITGFDSVITTFGILPEVLTASVIGNVSPISTVLFELLSDDNQFPDGAIATLTNITTDKQAPTATFVADTAGTYKVRLTVTDGAANTDEALVEIQVYANSCAAKKAAPSGWSANYYDRNGDCLVDLSDLKVFTAQWLNNTAMIVGENY